MGHNGWCDKGMLVMYSVIYLFSSSANAGMVKKGKERYHEPLLIKDDSMRKTEHEREPLFFSLLSDFLALVLCHIALKYLSMLNI